MNVTILKIALFDRKMRQYSTGDCSKIVFKNDSILRRIEAVLKTNGDLINIYFQVFTLFCLSLV